MFNLPPLFDTSGFMPRWECGAWPPFLGWLHIASDLLIWLAYLAIPVVLVYFVRRRRDVPFPRVFWLFGAFIVACGTTHLIEAVIFYHPVYQLSGAIKLATAAVSWATVFALVRVVPKALAVRTPQQLEAEVTERTAELADANATLRREADERQRAECALRESEERLKLALAGARMGVWQWDVQTGAVYWSPECYAIVGRREFGGTLQSFTSVVHPDDVAGVLGAAGRALEGRTEYTAEFRVVRPDGEVRWVSNHGRGSYDERGHPVRLIGLVQDITGRKQSEGEVRDLVAERERTLTNLRAKTEELRVTTQQLWQAARLAGVGELAASIAHELNNPLGIVTLRLERVLAKTPPDDPRRKPLEVIEQEVERMAGLVGNLLNFSRAGRDQVSTVDVCEEVTKTVDLIGHHLRKHQVRVETEFANGVPPIHADRQQLRQVLLNLFTNAADAMPRGGMLSLRVRSSSLSGVEPAVSLEVSDSGTGIPAELLPRVIDPFFTTKEEGKGTGLGLAICKRILDQHHGSLEIESRIGEGTTVRITFPIETTAAAARG